MPDKYLKKPVEIQAIQWNGENWQELIDWAGNTTFWAFEDDEMPNEEDPDATAAVFDLLHSTWVLVQTGDYIIQGVRGEFYPCREDVFLETYEKVVSD